MLELFLFPLLAFALIALVVKLASGAAARLTNRSVEARFRAADCLVNQGRLPGAWIEPYVRRAAAARQQAAGDTALAALYQEARKHCAHQLEDLLAFFQTYGTFDPPDSRQHLLKALRDWRARCAGDDWRSAIDLSSAPLGSSGPDE